MYPQQALTLLRPPFIACFPQEFLIQSEDHKETCVYPFELEFYHPPFTQVLTRKRRKVLKKEKARQFLRFMLHRRKKARFEHWHAWSDFRIELRVLATRILTRKLHRLWKATFPPFRLHATQWDAAREIQRVWWGHLARVERHRRKKWRGCATRIQTVWRMKVQWDARMGPSSS